MSKPKKTNPFGFLTRWRENTPGLRAVIMPSFGKNAWNNFFLATGFAEMCNFGLYSLHALYHGFAWLLLCLVGFGYIVVKAISITEVVVKLRRLRSSPAFSLELKTALYKTAAELPNVMLFVWCLFYICGSPSVWLNRATLLVWLNYFAVGCAVALRRGVDDLRHRRNASA